jgi:hypothetical protein
LESVVTDSLSRIARRLIDASSFREELAQCFDAAVLNPILRATALEFG